MKLKRGKQKYTAVTFIRLWLALESTPRCNPNGL
jgi:hypothetical protein